MTIPTDRELAQAYDQGWQDGRRGLDEELAAALRDAVSGLRYIENTSGRLYGVGWDRVYSKARAALAKVAQDAPATKGE